MRRSEVQTLLDEIAELKLKIARLEGANEALNMAVKFFHHCFADGRLVAVEKEPEFGWMCGKEYP